MDRIVPWCELCALIEPVYPKAGDGRPPKELEMMLRVYFLQQWFNLSDPGAEEALYDSSSMRRFAGIDLGEMPVPDESTVLRFRHLLEAHGLGEKLFQQVHAYLERQGIKIGTGTIIDATIISAPPSTKNKDKSRDPDMHQTKKGNQWYFGMKAHIGVDSQTKVIHAVAATAANVHDSVCLPDLLHGEETLSYRYKDTVDEEEWAKNRTKSSVRAKVEHPFLIIKRIFGFAKTRYKGLAKNAHRLFVTCALTNLYLMRRRLWRLCEA
jgi:IS5 family transposase